MYRKNLIFRENLQALVSPKTGRVDTSLGHVVAALNSTGRKLEVAAFKMIRTTRIGRELSGASPIEFYCKSRFQERRNSRGTEPPLSCARVDSPAR